MKVIITFDCERDWYAERSGWSHTYSSRPVFTMLQKAIPRFLELGEKYGLKYTFFLTGEVAMYLNNLFKEIDHEIGVHTHPFVHLSLFNYPPKKFLEKDELYRYPYEMQLNMIKKDIQLIKQNLGVTPLSFRAGGLCYNELTRKAIKKAGLLIDSSLRYLYNIIGWKPFFVDGIFEVPIYTWLSPTVNWKIALSKFSACKFLKWLDTCFVINIHPMEFGRDDIYLNDAWIQFENLIRVLRGYGVEFCTLKDLYENYKNKITKYSVINYFGLILRFFAYFLHKKSIPPVTGRRK